MAPPRPWKSVSSTPCRRAVADQRRLGAVELPVRGQEAARLVRVRVAEHHLLAIATAGQVGAVARIGQEPVEERGRPLERGRRLQQGHEVQLRRIAAAVAPAGRSGRRGQVQDVENVPGVAR